MKSLIFAAEVACLQCLMGEIFDDKEPDDTNEEFIVEDLDAYEMREKESEQDLYDGDLLQ